MHALTHAEAFVTHAEASERRRTRALVSQCCETNLVPTRLYAEVESSVGMTSEADTQLTIL